MPPRIVTISDHVDCPTGFGVQHRHLAAALASAGYDVHSLGLWDTRPLAAIPDSREEASARPSPHSALRTPHSALSLTRYPAGFGVEDHRRAWTMYRELLRPDLVITLGDFAMFRHLNEAEDRDFAWCHWLPVDALPYPSRDHKGMLGYDHLVLMSRFGFELVRPHLEGRVPLHYIPHGVDLRVFRPHDDPLALRRRWSRRLGAELRPDDFLLIARDANQWRKQQPLLLEALAKLPADVKLILQCRPVAHPRANGWDLPHLARLYGVADRVVFTSPEEEGKSGPLPPGEGRVRAPVTEQCPVPGALTPTLSQGEREKGPLRPEGRTTSEEGPPPFCPAELAELDNLADLRVSATQGEGFGVITIESMACGTPTLITDYATSRELILGSAECGVRNAECPAASPQLCGPSMCNLESGIRNELDPFGPAGELVRVAAWAVEQGRHLFRPIADAGDLAARVLALRGDRGRLARYAEAGLRRVLAHYTLGRVATDWVTLARRVLAERGVPALPHFPARASAPARSLPRASAPAGG